MKISTFLFILLFVGIVVATMATMTNEASDYYDVDINTSLYEGKYDYAESINESIQPTITAVNDVSNQELGWLEKVGSGFTGIIAAVTLLPKLVWNAFGLGGGLITEGLGSLGVPAYIILVILIGLTIWGVVKLIEFFQRWPL